MPVSVAHVKKIYKNRCKSMIIRGATKDPVDVGVEGPCIVGFFSFTLESHFLS